MTETSNLQLPLGACDSHLHIYDSFAKAGLSAISPLRSCTSQQYKALRDCLVLQRAVVVNPAPYGVDNSVTLAAIETLGAQNTRGVAVVFPSVTDHELERLHAGGIRGIRFTVFNPQTAVTSVDMIEPLAARVHALGWHVQLHMTAAQLVQQEALLRRLPCTLVFDHLARLAQLQDDAQAWRIVLDLLATGRTWVKLSGHYLAANAERAKSVAQRLLQEAPERMVWGSDWPHPTEMPSPPKTVTTLQALHEWVPDAHLREQVLVRNPQQLYDFE